MRRLLKMPPQIFRIVLLAAAIVGSYLMAREVLTPPSFHQHGFFRGDALGELAAREPVFAGRKACSECHEEEVKALAAHDHKSLSCEGCHGAAQAHVDNPDIKPQVLHYSHCARCHEANVSRPKWHKQISTKDHYAGSKCTECHVPHMPKEVP
ncbi:MAG TPA: hypothetical protein VNT26_05270 [Candidatus Sulfotelmatobacter sp.]|nr:hypothetical protein [Candidatus Sulfotelmatobacter sp.]HWI59911.1 hypothetical protein [Bacillota bacterium]